MYYIALFYIVIFAVESGCQSKGNTNSDGQASSFDSGADQWVSSDRSGSIDLPGVAELTGSEICDRYLSCLLKAMPEGFPGALELYDENSACWKTAAAKSGCEESCDKGYQELAKAFPTIEACGGGKTTGCNTSQNPFTGTCAEVMNSFAQCFKTQGKCTVTSGTTTWENGAKIEVSGLGGDTMTFKYFGSGASAFV